jgi:OOP family OmpA-OmpF porin
MRRPWQLSLEIHFDTNSDTIEPQSLANLDELASLAQDFMARKISIIGHADSRDTAAYNIQLSTRRAQRVSEYLKTRGISTASFQLQAKGEDKPVATNTTPRGRALNRRTQVVVNF